MHAQFRTVEQCGTKAATLDDSIGYSEAIPYPQPNQEADRLNFCKLNRRVVFLSESYEALKNVHIKPYGISQTQFNSFLQL